MRGLNPLGDLTSLADEVRDGYRTLLRVLVGIGDLLASHDRDEPVSRWFLLREDLHREGRL